MSSIDQGMNADEVESLANVLKSSADELGRMAGSLDAAVRRPAWSGPSATRFRSQWWPQHRAAIRKLSDDLRGFGDSALHNLAEQRRASAAVDGQPRSNRADGAGTAGNSPRYETSRHGFSTSSKFGFIVTGESKADSQFIYYSDGRATYEITLEDATRVNLNDVAKLVKIGTITAGQAGGTRADASGLELRFDAAFSTGKSVVVASWTDRDPSSVGEIGNHFVQKQAAPSNFWALGGEFDQSDVKDSIRSGDVPPPDVVRYSSSAVDGRLSVGVERDGRAVDLVVEASAQRFVTQYRAEGVVGNGIAFETKAGTHTAVATASLGPFGAEIGIDHTVLNAGSLEIVRDADGRALRAEIVEIHGATVGPNVNVFDFYTASSSTGLNIERSLTFDFTDPAVASSLGSPPNLGSVLASYQSASHLAAETVVVRSTAAESDGSGVWTAGGTSGTSSSAAVGASHRAAGTQSFQRL
jgi:uncharacterized protein YukE